jgi:hypothetical protein
MDIILVEVQQRLSKAPYQAYSIHIRAEKESPKGRADLVMQ